MRRVEEEGQGEISTPALRKKARGGMRRVEEEGQGACSTRALRKKARGGCGALRKKARVMCVEEEGRGDLGLRFRYAPSVASQVNCSRKSLWSSSYLRSCSEIE